MLEKMSPFMAEAIRIAEHGMHRIDGGPFGAVVVKEEKIIGRGWNKVLSSNDPTAHAEITAIRDACTTTDSYWLEGCRIYISCEPCPMCLAAIYWARIDQIIFAATRLDAEQIGFIDGELYREICAPVDERSLQIRREGRDAAVDIMQKWPTLSGHREY